MGMDYIPVYADEVNAPKERKCCSHRNPMGQPDTSPVPKRQHGMDYIPVYADDAPAEKRLVKIDAVRRQKNLGVTSVPVKMGTAFPSGESRGHVAVDEPRQFTITSKLDGWVDKLYVNATGEQVKSAVSRCLSCMVRN